jgi:hypothetical protein
MKLAILIALALAGCSSKVIVKDCQHLGQSIFECKEL